MTIKTSEVTNSRVAQLQNTVIRNVKQIGATTKFEFVRNKWNALIALGIAALLYVLSLIINTIQENRGVELTDQVDYLQSYLTMVNLVVVVIALIFAGNIISEDYQKDTGNLIFPKTTKGRLLIGRIIARYLLTAMAITLFYALVGITSWIKFDSLIAEFWKSWGWALFYSMMIFSFIVFFSSFMKSNVLTIISSLLILLIVFPLISQILVITGSSIEPLFVLTYYANIISEIFDMPAERFAERPLLGPGGFDTGETIFSWSTPSVQGAAIGLSVAIVVFLTGAYIIFRYRQKK